MKLVKPIVLLSCAVALCFSLPLMTAAATTWTVVVDGLDNPRGVAFGPEGALYIAQAGSGGSGACGPGPEGTRCYGETGVISRYELRSGNVTDVVTGLPSLATEEGGMFAIGPNDLSLQGRGNLFFTIGFGGDPTAREDLFGADGAKLAHLGRATPDGKWRLLSDLGQSEADNNPTGDEVDSIPTASSRCQASRSWPTRGRTPCSRSAAMAPSLRWPPSPIASWMRRRSSDSRRDEDPDGYRADLGRART